MQIGKEDDTDPDITQLEVTEPSRPVVSDDEQQGLADGTDDDSLVEEAAGDDGEDVSEEVCTGVETGLA